jgi:hypothetical protein
MIIRENNLNPANVGESASGGKLVPNGLGTPLSPPQDGRRHLTLETATSELLDVTWRELGLRVPAFLGIFAIAFVVGYFYAFDISWFSLFGIWDQLVFALRSLPVAVGATLVLLMFLKISLDSNKLPKRVERLLFFGLSLPWLLTVSCGAVYMFYTNHPGAGFGFVLMLIGTAYFELEARFRRPPVHIMYWGPKVTVVCMVIGYISGNMLIYQGQDDVTVSVTGKELKGRLIFSGSNGVLIYSKDKGEVLLVRWENICEISSKLYDHALGAHDVADSCARDDRAAAH